MNAELKNPPGIRPAAFISLWRGYFKLTISTDEMG